MKKLFSVFLSLALLASICQASKKVTNEDLNMWYAQCNEDYFMDQLPKNTEVVLGDLRADGFLGYTFAEGGRYHIIIDRTSNYGQVTAKLTLLHEMCHIKVPNSAFHEMNFQTCMMNLASQGAFHDLW